MGASWSALCTLLYLMKTSPNTVRGNIARHCEHWRRACGAILAAGFLPAVVRAQTAFTWQQIKDKFEAANPTLKAAQLNIDESRAAEITAYLRPNPDFTGPSIDSIPVASLHRPGNSVYRPLPTRCPLAPSATCTNATTSGSCGGQRTQVHRRLPASTYLDQERGLLFNLRSAFVQTLQAKAVLQNARENLDYWDRELT